MDTKAWAARNLAARLLAGPWTRQAIADGIEAVLGPVPPRTRAALVVRLAALAEGTYPPAPGALTAYLIASTFFRPPRTPPVAVALDAPRFAPMRPFAGLPIPALATLGELADRTGPDAQNRAEVPDFRSHLEGRVAWVEQVNPARGAKLRRLLGKSRGPDSKG